jgi:hypothetical protein
MKRAVTFSFPIDFLLLSRIYIPLLGGFSSSSAYISKADIAEELDPALANRLGWFSEIVALCS